MAERNVESGSGLAAGGMGLGSEGSQQSGPVDQLAADQSIGSSRTRTHGGGASSRAGAGGNNQSGGNGTRSEEGAIGREM